MLHSHGQPVRTAAERPVNSHSIPGQESLAVGTAAMALWGGPSLPKKQELCSSVADDKDRARKDCQQQTALTADTGQFVARVSRWCLDVDRQRPNRSLRYAALGTMSMRRASFAPLAAIKEITRQDATNAVLPSAWP